MRFSVGTEYMVSSDELKNLKVGYVFRLSDKVTFVKYFEDYKNVF
jgi:hypothetical protein